MALLEIRRPTPQAGGFYQYTMSEEQVGIMTLIILIFQDDVIEMLYLQAPPQQEIDRQQAVVESTADCIVPRLPQVIFSISIIFLP